MSNDIEDDYDEKDEENRFLDESYSIIADFDLGIDVQSRISNLRLPEASEEDSESYKLIYKLVQVSCSPADDSPSYNASFDDSLEVSPRLRIPRLELSDQSESPLPARSVDVRSTCQCTHHHPCCCKPTPSVTRSDFVYLMIFGVIVFLASFLHFLYYLPSSPTSVI